MASESTYYVRGMHCPSCEILIENKVKKLKNIVSVSASSTEGKLTIKHRGEKPSPEYLNKIFSRNGYFFSNNLFDNQSTGVREKLLPLGVASLVVATFLILGKLGFGSLVNVTSRSSLPAFFLFGLVAGFSSCAALVGSIVLSLSQQWNKTYSDSSSSWKKLEPHLAFNTGRIFSYGIGGFLLGTLGAKITLTANFGPWLVGIVSLLMAFTALQMLLPDKFGRFRFILPKSITGHLANTSNLQGYFLPFLTGAATFLLPCGFTLTSQSLAIVSGSGRQGALIMLAFVLGTLPSLLAIGWSSAKISHHQRWAGIFSQTAAFLILFFAIYNINFQLNVLGLVNFGDFFGKSKSAVAGTKNELGTEKSSFPPLVDGKQVIKMEASASGYSPNYFQVKAGVPVRWEITDKGTSGCTNAVISKSLFSGEIRLTPGQTSIKEFTPEKTGKYKFSCWMGMVSGVIEVVDSNGKAQSLSSPAIDETLNSPGVNQSCGCGQK